MCASFAESHSQAHKRSKKTQINLTPLRRAVQLMPQSLRPPRWMEAWNAPRESDPVDSSTNYQRPRGPSLVVDVYWCTAHELGWNLVHGIWYMACTLQRLLANRNLGSSSVTWSLAFTLSVCICDISVVFLHFSVSSARRHIWTAAGSASSHSRSKRLRVFYFM